MAATARSADRSARTARPAQPRSLDPRVAAITRAPRVRSVPDALGRTAAAIAADQHHVLRRVDLLGIGVDDDRIRRWRRAGRLHLRFPGVYAIGAAELSERGAWLAAVFAGGGGAVLATHASAALAGFAPAPPAPAVLVPGASRRGPRGLEVIRARVLLPEDVHEVDGIPLTRPARTLLDCAPRTDPVDFDRLVHEAMVQRATSEAEVLACLERYPGRPGAPLLRGLVTEGHGWTRSRAEQELRRIVRGARLLAPDWNRWIDGMQWDAVWEELRLIVEVDGFTAHGDRAAFERDRERQWRIEQRGWTLRRFTWRMLRAAPLLVTARLARMVAERVDHRHSGR